MTSPPPRESTLTLGHVLELILCVPLVAWVVLVLVNGALPPQEAIAPVAAPAESATASPAIAQSQEVAGVDPEAPPEPDESAAAAAPVGANGEPAKPAAKPEVKSPPAEPAAARRPSGPWDFLFADDFQPPAFAEVCFQQFDKSKSLPQREELLQWFEAVPGRPLDLKNVRGPVGQCGEFNGVMRLKTPLDGDQALRLTIANHTTLQLHFFHGTTGVTLVTYPAESHRWTAYRTTRELAAATPTSFDLIATDGYRGRASEYRPGAEFELRHHGGRLILTRGDVVILRVPLESPPTDIFFEGHAAVHGIALLRTKDFPLANEPLEFSQLAPAGEPAADTAAKTALPKPVEWNWAEPTAPGLRLERDAADGSIALIGENVATRGFALAPLPQRGLHEFIFRIDEATPGTGLLLQRGGSVIHENVRWLKDNPTGRTCATLMIGLDDTRDRSFPKITERTVPFAPSPQWIRLLACGGIVRWWLSADGRTWAEPELGIGAVPGEITHVGLFHAGGNHSGRIKLSELRLEKFPAIESLTDAALLPQAPANVAEPTLGGWLARAAERQPAGADDDAWRVACAIQSLAAGCSAPLAAQLLDLLLDESERRRDLLADRFAALREVSRLHFVRDDVALQQRLRDRYARLAMQAAEQTGVAPLTSIRRELQRWPFASIHRVPFADERAGNRELLQRIDAGQWDAALDLCRELRFYEQSARVPLLGWAEQTIAHHQPGSRAVVPIASRKAEWQHPLMLELDKDGYNEMAELKAILASEAYDDAARTITSLHPESFPGLTYSLDDRRLFVSLPTAIGMLLNAYPPLSEAIGQRYGAVAELRIREAIRDDNRAALELAAVQFAASPPVAEAHRWLGDQALSGGWFLRAIDQYQRALAVAAVSQRAELEARLRLAASMIGRTQGTAATGSVRFGNAELTAADFESLLADLQKTRAAAADLAAATAGEELGALPAAGYQAQLRARLEAPFGESPATELIPRNKQYGLDWVGRQLATVTAGDRLLVSNRFQVAAYDLANGGQRLWQSLPPHPKSLRSQDWGLTPMRPLLAGERIFARLLYEHGPMLVCLNAADGTALWTLPSSYNLSIVSDPLLVQGQLLVLQMSRLPEGDSVLQLALIDRQTGHVLRATDLLRLGETWWRRRVCEVAPTGDGLLAVLGGIALHCQPTGELKWVRESPLLPPSEEPRWVLQHPQRPIVHGQQVILVQPGVASIDGLDLATGRRIWSVLLPDLQRVLGQFGSDLIVQTDEGFLALDAATGDRRWFTAAQNVLHFAAVSSDGQIVFARKQPAASDAKQFDPQLVWLSAQEGQVQGTAKLAGLTHADPRLGPLALHKGRVWSFFGRGHDDATRDLIELTAARSADPPPPAAATSVWRRSLPPALLDATPRFFAGWSLLSGATTPDAQPEVPEKWGHMKLLGIRAAAGSPVVLARPLSIPAGAKARLRIGVLNEPAQTWTLTVRHGGQDVIARPVTAASDIGHWKEIEIDLSPRAGHSGLLVIQADAGVPFADLYWKKLEIAF